MNKINKGLISVFAFALMLPGVASAAVINLGASTLNNNTVNDFSVDGLIDFDILLNQSGQTYLIIDLSAAEMAAGSVNLRFAGLAQAGLPGGLETVGISIDGGVNFDVVGDAFRSDGTAAPLDVLPNSVHLVFTPPEQGVFTVGNLGFGAVDWVLSFPVNSSSIRVTISAKEGIVPIPAGIWLLVSGIAGLGLFRRKAA